MEVLPLLGASTLLQICPTFSEEDADRTKRPTLGLPDHLFWPAIWSAQEFGAIQPHPSKESRATEVEQAL